MFILVFYIPETHLDAVKEALFENGAGRKGPYSRVCWQVLGEGQFQPEEGSTPFIGSAGALSCVPEYRVEMYCEPSCRETVEKALLQAHPYETPAYHFIEAAQLSL